MEGPDVGYAWIVALAACIINFIMSGLGRLSSILFVSFIEIYQVDRKGASLPLTLRSSSRNLTGPIIGILGQKYGLRKMMIIGGFIGTISAALCFIAPNILWITLLWGAMNGMSIAMTVTLSQVVIGQYFKKYRATAAGLGFSGCCVGSFMFPVLLEYFLQYYGFQGTFFIIAGVIAHVIPAAMVLKKPSWLKKEARNKEGIQEPVPSVSQSLDNLVNEERDEDVNIHVIEEYTSKDLYSESSEARKMAIADLREMRKSLYEKESVFGKIHNNCSKLSSDTQLDVPLLKENSDIVMKIFSLMRSKCEGNINEDNQLDFNIMEEFERSVNSYMSSQRSEKNKIVSDFKKEFLQVDFTKDFKSACNLNNRSLNLKNRFSEPVLMKIHSLPDIAKTYDGSSTVLNLMKMLEMISKNEQSLIESFQERKRKAVHVIAELQKLLIMTIYLESDITNAAEKNINSVKSNLEGTKLELPSNSLANHMLTAFKLYGNPLFLMVCFCRIGHFLVFETAMTTVVDFFIDKGLQISDGKYIIAAISFGDLVGRLCLGWITDKGFITLPKYMMILMVAQGICTATLPIMSTRIAIYTALAFFGMFQGSLFIRHPVLIYKYMRSHEQSIAMGCVDLFSGLLGFILPAYIGYFRDTIGSYDYIYIINGMTHVFIGLLWVFEPFFVRCINAKETKQTISV